MFTPKQLSSWRQGSRDEEAEWTLQTCPWCRVRACMHALSCVHVCGWVFPSVSSRWYKSTFECQAFRIRFFYLLLRSSVHPPAKLAQLCKSTPNGLFMSVPFHHLKLIFRVSCRQPLCVRTRLGGLVSSPKTLCPTTLWIPNHFHVTTASKSFFFFFWTNLQTWGMAISYPLTCTRFYF